jgi:hypothetical protein
MLQVGSRYDMTSVPLLVGNMDIIKPYQSNIFYEFYFLNCYTVYNESGRASIYSHHLPISFIYLSTDSVAVADLSYTKQSHN